MVMTWPTDSVSIVLWLAFSSRLLTIDPATVVGGQECYHAGDIFWYCAALQWAVLGHELLDLVGWPIWSSAWDVTRERHDQ